MLVRRRAVTIIDKQTVRDLIHCLQAGNNTPTRCSRGLQPASARVPKLRCDVGDELIHVATQFLQRPEHRWYEERRRARGLELPKLFANLFRRSCETGIP